jgi:enoyl-CoA hydratase/carnithine racemase
VDLPDIIYKKSPPLAFMSLNRPETRNVFTYPMMESLCKSLEILLTGRVIKIDEALRIGLVDRVVPKEELIKETENYAMEIARRSLASLRMIKRGVIGW